MFSRSAAAYTLILVLALAGCGGQLKNREAGVGSGGDDTFPDGSNLSGGSGGEIGRAHV